MPRPVILLLVLIVLFASPLAAQRAPYPIHVGDRVRVYLRRGEPRQELRGTITALGADSLTLRIDPAVSPVTVAFSAVRRLDVSRGTPPALEGALWGSVRAAPYGIYALSGYNNRDGDFGSNTQAAFWGAGLGAGLGALVGALWPQERWQRLRAGEGERAPELAPPFALGSGLVELQAADISGGGGRAEASVRLAHFAGENADLRAEVSYERATAEGSLFSCRRFRQIHCLGGEDRTDRFGAGLSVVKPFDVGGERVRPYWIPLGVGVFHRRTSRTESQGPTGICVDNGEVTGCPDNPPFESVEYRVSRTGVGINTGLGTDVRLGGATLFGEFRAFRILERGGDAGAVPLTVGIRL